VSRDSLAEEKGGRGENLGLSGDRCFLKGAAAWGSGGPVWGCATQRDEVGGPIGEGARGKTTTQGRSARAVADGAGTRCAGAGLDWGGWRARTAPLR
jgi:hypothetical protein